MKVLNGEVTKERELAVAGGTYSDIWLGTWLGEEKVGMPTFILAHFFLGCLKALRTIKVSDIKAQKASNMFMIIYGN